MLTSTLEVLLNRGLPRSPRARELVADLAGRRLAIELSGISEWTITSDGHAVGLTHGPASDADVRIAGGALSLFAVLASGSTAPLQRGEVQLTGDAALAEKFRELLKLLRPDLEEELALAIGDVPAHELARGTRGAIAWCVRTGDTVVRNLAEYLAHERGDLVSGAEGRQLLAGVDTLREDVDRIAARLELLTERIAAGRHPK